MICYCQQKSTSKHFLLVFDSKGFAVKGKDESEIEFTYDIPHEINEFKSSSFSDVSYFIEDVGTYDFKEIRRKYPEYFI